MIMRVRINLDGKSAAAHLVGLATKIEAPVYLTDGANMRVSAKSLLGAVCAQFDFTEIWLEVEGDHYFLFKDFIVEE